MSTEQAPLWKQIAGAGMGALIAVTIYAAYKATSSSLTGMTILPQVRIGSDSLGEVRIADIDVSDRESKRMIARAQMIANDLSQYAPRPTTTKQTAAAPTQEPPNTPAMEDTKETAPVTEPTKPEAPKEPLISEPLQPLQPIESIEPIEVEVTQPKTVATPQHVVAPGSTDLPDSGLSAWLIALVALLLPSLYAVARHTLIVRKATV